ncbi:MAG TPA: DUF4956 domain-containing protein [Vicinamibacterales bacterium]|jgi:uncharacterized membrane protein YhiD involved in acid resistance|nr:DUF4956 domain-containing protein [Vicinamibacterales bacterium]
MTTRTTRKLVLGVGLAIWVLAAVSAAPIVRAQKEPDDTQTQSAQSAEKELVAPKSSKKAVAPLTGDARDEWEHTLDLHALVALPLAAALGAALALRPRRRGTPNRSSPVIQTQIILAVIAAVVMLVVGSSLARAFGVVGAAGLVRYRSKIADPKDAGVMLSTLAVGLACGVGVYPLAIFATIFIVGTLYVIESFEPHPGKVFTLEVKAKEAAKVQPRVESLLRRRKVKFELREASPDEISYEVRLPMEAKTDTLSAEIMELDPDKGTAVNWSPAKEKNV